MTKTVFTLIKNYDYVELLTLPFLYKKPNGSQLRIDGKIYVLEKITDDIGTDLSVTRTIYVYEHKK